MKFGENLYNQFSDLPYVLLKVCATATEKTDLKLLREVKLTLGVREGYQRHSRLLGTINSYYHTLLKYLPQKDKEKIVKFCLSHLLLFLTKTKFRGKLLY